MTTEFGTDTSPPDWSPTLLVSRFCLQNLRLNTYSGTSLAVVEQPHCNRKRETTQRHTRKTVTAIAIDRTNLVMSHCSLLIGA